MTLPRIEVSVTGTTTLSIANYSGHGTPPRRVDIALSEFNQGGFTLAANRVGGVILKTLALWHRREFERLEAFKALNKLVPHDMELISMLIAKSMAAKTCAYVHAIEHLLRDAEHDSAECRKFLREIWPSLRQMLSHYPD
jgi:hypothetical protein